MFIIFFKVKYVYFFDFYVKLDISILPNFIINVILMIKQH